MAIKKEIFDDFVSKLKLNTNLPDEIASRIEEEWNLNNEISKEEILSVITSQNDTKD